MKATIVSKPKMQQGGQQRTDSDNTRYAGNRYYDMSPVLPPGAAYTNNYYPTVMDNLMQAKQVTYPGDTLTQNQIEAYKRSEYMNSGLNMMNDDAISMRDARGNRFYYEMDKASFRYHPTALKRASCSVIVSKNLLCRKAQR